MSVNVYYSTDAGAPVLTGEVGSLVNLLDKVLVDGYGAKAALGWSKAFTGTNKGAYRQPLGTNRMYLQVLDNTPAGGPGAQVAAVRGYEAMSDVDTGSGAFPTAAQAANALCVLKSFTASSTARPWFVVGDEALFYLCMDYSSDGGGQMCAFGDVIPYRPGDAFHTILIGGVMSATSAFYTQSFFEAVSRALNLPSSTHYLARNYTQIGGAVTFGKIGDGLSGDAMAASNLSAGANVLAYPAPNNNGLFVSQQVRMSESGTLRGLMPGLYYPLHAVPLADKALVSNVPGLAGRSLLAKVTSNGGGVATRSQCLFDITGPWR